MSWQNGNGNAQRNIGMGIYTPGTQFNFDVNTLLRLGFDRRTVAFLNQIVMAEGKISVQKLCNMGMDYNSAKDLKYMYDIAVGRITIESERDLIQHLRKVFGKTRRIGITDLTVSRVREVPKVAVIAGIKDEPYTIYNSKQYDLKGMFYRVTEVSRSRITIETRRKPRLKWGTPKKIDGVLEILELKENGNVVVAFDKSVCRLCNRFIVVASLKRPEFHLGMAEIICIEGTKVYVYAQILKPTDSIRYNNGTQRVYSFGYLKNDIEQQVMKVASELYGRLCGVVGKTYPGNQDFILLPEVGRERAEEAEVQFDE